MRTVQPPHAKTNKPRLIAPPGACDTHLHVYGAPESYPLAPERNYTPNPHSMLDDYSKVHRALGLQRAVVVTGSANGTNNQVTLDALNRMGGTFKGLAKDSGSPVFASKPTAQLVTTRLARVFKH